MTEMIKVVVFCPESHVEKIINIMADNGAGVIGEYTHCAYITKGFGNWMPEEGSNPYSGKQGEMSREEESRIEMVCRKNRIDEVINSVKAIHPYETPVIEIYEMKLA